MLYTLYSALWQTCSIKDFSWNCSAMLQLLHKDKYVPLSIASYSFPQLSELEQCGVTEIVQCSKQKREALNPEFSDY